MSKCKNCGIYLRAMASSEPACCMWYLDNVVCGDKSLEECNVYEPVKPDDTEAFNDFESEEDYDESEEYV